MLDASLGLTGSLLAWIGINSNDWSMLRVASTALLRARWVARRCIDLMADTPGGSDIAITLQNLLSGDVGRIIKERAVIQD